MTETPLQILLVVETSDEDKSDTIYINEVLKTYFDTKFINLRYIYLKGKTNYNKKNILSYINNQTNVFRKVAKGKTVVIYFIDTDSTNKEYKKGSIFSNISEFVKQKSFELVWFCKNSENVFLNKEPSQIDNKTKVAKVFSSSGKINDINVSNLDRNEIELNCSNIYGILSKYLMKK